MPRLLMDQREGEAVTIAEGWHVFAARPLEPVSLPHLCLCQCCKLPKFSTKATSSMKRALTFLFLPHRPSQESLPPLGLDRGSRSYLS